MTGPKLPERNYFTLEKIPPDDIKLGKELWDKMSNLGIVKKLQANSKRN